MARLLFLAASVALAVTVFSSFPAGKVAVASSPTGPKTWSHVGGNPQNTGQVGGQVASNGHQQWSFNTNNVVTAGVAISANRIFVGSQEGVMYALELPPVNGWEAFKAGWGGGKPSVAWHISTGGAISVSPTLSADGSALYFGNGNSKFYGINTADGSHLFSPVETFSSVSTPPTIVGDLVMFGTSGELFFAVDAKSGDVSWRCAARASISGAPAVSSDASMVYMASEDTFLYGFAPANVTCRPGVVNGKGSVCQTITSTTNPGNDQTGCGTWSLSPGRISFTSPPLLDEANNRILAVAQNEADETTIFSINLAKVQPGVNDPKTCDCVTTVAAGLSQRADTGLVKLNNETVVFGASGGSLMAVNSWTGAKVWEFSTSLPIASTPVVSSAGNIVFGANDKNVYCLNAQGAELWHTSTDDRLTAPPAITSAGSVVIGGLNGNLYSVGGSNITVVRIIVVIALLLLLSCSCCCCIAWCRRRNRAQAPLRLGRGQYDELGHTPASKGGDYAVLSDMGGAEIRL